MEKHTKLEIIKFVEHHYGRENFENKLIEMLKHNSIITNESIEGVKDELSVQVYNVLKAVGITSIEQLSSYSKREVLRFRAIGNKSVKQIEDMLYKRGLTLRQFH